MNFIIKLCESARKYERCEIKFKFWFIGELKSYKNTDRSSRLEKVTRVRIAYAAGATFEKVDKTIGGIEGYLCKFSIICEQIIDFELKFQSYKQVWHLEFHFKTTKINLCEMDFLKFTLFEHRYFDSNISMI